VNDIDFGQGHIRHTPLKTKRLGKVVTIPLHPVLEAILRELQNIQAKQMNMCSRTRRIFTAGFSRRDQNDPASF
jgi:integrase